MQRLVPKYLILLLAAILSIGLVACGDSNGDGAATADTDDGFAPLTEASDSAVSGGRLTVLSGGDVQSLDPGTSYDQLDYMVHFATNRTLMGWPTDAEEPQPDLADGEPEISDDGRTLTFKIKSGIRYSPPVDREVVAADFKYGIERGLMPGVANGYIHSYLSALEGFEEAVGAVEQTPGVAPEISGIGTPDDNTLVLEFNEAVALNATQVLSLPLGAPVPREYAAEFDAENPSAYGHHAVATGPYMVANNAEGELTGHVPGESLELVRNPNWDAETDFRPAYLDSIELQAGFSNTPAAATRILEGNGMVNAFLADPESLKGVTTERPEQLALAPQGGNRYVTLNTQLAPFDDINVRKALLAAVDREAMRLTIGGETIGAIANHFIPPGMPGFEEAGGYEGTGVDFLANPAGDLELAADYMRKAGFESGTYEGDAQLLVVGANSTVERRSTEVVLDALDELGFDVNYRPVSRDAMFTRFCLNPAAEVAICPNIGWAKDFNSPQTILAPTFSGDAIQPENNTNISMLDVPEINEAMAEAATLTDADEQAEAWGEIDRMVTAQAPALPWAWDYFPSLSSADVTNVINTFLGITDLSSTSLEQEG